MLNKLRLIFANGLAIFIQFVGFRMDFLICQILFVLSLAVGYGSLLSKSERNADRKRFQTAELFAWSVFFSSWLVSSWILFPCKWAFVASNLLNFACLLIGLSPKEK